MAVDLNAAKSKHARRLLRKRDPVLQETVKKTMCIRGPKASETGIAALRDLHKLSFPRSLLLRKRNDIRPFDDFSSIEFLSKRSDHSLFSLVSHSKKRPNNLIFGRLFNYEMNDLYEFSIDQESFISIRDFDAVRKRQSTVKVGSKPLLIFQGLEWDYNADFQSFKNFAIDFFRGDVLEKINLASIDHIIVMTVLETTVFFRHYGIILKKSGTKLPRVELEEIGPRMNLLFRRRKEGSEAIKKQSMKFAPKEQIQLAKNISLGEYGNKKGRVYMGKQDFNKLALRRMKALKRKKTDNNEGERREEGGNNNNNSRGRSRSRSGKDEEGSNNRMDRSASRSSSVNRRSESQERTKRARF